MWDEHNKQATAQSRPLLQCYNMRLAVVITGTWKLGHGGSYGTSQGDHGPLGEMIAMKATYIKNHFNVYLP